MCRNFFPSMQQCVLIQYQTAPLASRLSFSIACFGGCKYLGEYVSQLMDCQNIPNKSSIKISIAYNNEALSASSEIAG